MSGRKTQKRKGSSGERQICIGRVCFEKDKYQPTPGAKYRYRAHQCDKPCEEGKNLCKSCLKHEEMFLTGDPRKWHGREGGPLPEDSHIENSAWDLEWRVKEAAALQKQAAPKSEKAKTAVKKAVKAVQEVQAAADNVVDAMTEAVISTNNVDMRAMPSPKPKTTVAEVKAQKAVRKAIQARENAGELVIEANKLVTAAEKVVVQEAVKAKSKRTTQRRKKSSPLIYRPGSAATTPRSTNRKSMSRGQATPYASPQKPSVSPVGSYASPAAMMRRNWATPYGSQTTSSESPAIMPVVTVKKVTTSPVPSSSSIPSSNSTNLDKYAENLLLA
jgi:hypothetical protein